MFLQGILSQCAKGHLSAQLLSLAELDQHVSLLLRKRAFRGLEVALSNLNMFYTEKLTQCAIDGSSLHFWIKIPLKTLERNCKIVSYIPLPFIWQSAICRIFPEDTDVLAAVSEKQVVPFHGLTRKHCLENSVCQIPRVDTSFSAQGKCLGAILAKRTVAELADSCSLHCNKAHQPEVVQTAPDQFIVASPPNHTVTVHCGIKETTPNRLNSGAFRFHLPGNCSVRINGQLTISERRIMPSMAAADYKVEIVLPAMWTEHLGFELDMLHNLDSSPVFENESFNE